MVRCVAVIVWNSDTTQQFREAVVAASRRSEVHDAVRNLHRAVQDQIELLRPLCAKSGRCCRFDSFSHRLMVTTMEAATFLHELPGRLDGCGNTSADSAAPDDACPFQHGSFCSVHSIRPFGCRIFFCDDTTREWQSRQYERFHAELKRLHDALVVPYFYVEWRQGLRALQIPNPQPDTFSQVVQKCSVFGQT